MSTGSKVVLLLTFLFIGVLIWYYGPESESPKLVATDPTLAITAETAVATPVPAIRATPPARAAASPDRPAVSPPSRTATAPSSPSWSPPTFRVPAAGPATRSPDPVVSSGATTLVMGQPLSARSGPDRPREAPVAATRTRSVTVQSPPQVAARDYVVVEGDTLSGIAVMYYGSELAWARIAEANPDVDPDRLRIGTSLRIPAHSPRTPRTTTKTTSATPVTGKSHRVEEGDSLSSIAIRYYGRDSRWSKIFEANRSMLQNDPDRLRIGMVLAIPSQ